MANPFPQDVQWNVIPAGPFESFNAGALQGRIYRQSGHIELVGPDLAGAPGAVTLRLAPPAIQTPAGVVTIGTLQSSQALPNGLELRQQLGNTQIKSRLIFPHDGVMRYEVLDWNGPNPIATAFAIETTANEHVYGFGERFINFDQAGRVVRTLTFDDPGVKTDHAYKVAPWYISTRGYGLHLDSSAESTLDMRVATGHAVITNLFPSLAVQFVYGPRLTDVLTRFTGYSGRPPLPPPFTFGPWISSDIWRSGGEVRYAVTQFRQRGIPASAFVFDSPWEVAYNDFRFNMTQFGRDATIDGQHFSGFASLGDMMQFLQANGLKVICWIAPFVNTSSFNENVPGQNLGKAANYDAGAAENVFVRQSQGGPPLVVPWWKGHGSPIDFTSPAARQWFATQLNTLLTETQVATRSGAHESAIGGFKTDDGESSNGPNTYIPTTAQYADGRTGIEMRNAYCVVYQKAVWDVLGDKGILFARSGFIGSPAFPACWAGDNEPNFGDNGLPGVIVAGQSAAMSGFAIWGHDTGGYQDTNFSVSPPNLFMRWTQFGCFSPIMQMHRQVAREMQYPWRYGQQALDNFRFYTRLHTQLFPYIYTYAKLAGTAGLPIIRPLVLMAQDDANTFALRHVYHFGNEILVAPILEPNAVTRQIYLPQGAWFDFWTNVRHAGGQTITWTDQDPTRIPVLIREGSIVPMLLNETDTLCDGNYINNPTIRTLSDGLKFLIYPARSSAFTLFDGTEVRCVVQGPTLTITITVGAQPILLQVHTRLPTSVTRDGSAIPHAANQAAFDAAPSAWQVDAATQSILVKSAHNGGSSAIQLS